MQSHDSSFRVWWKQHPGEKNRLSKRKEKGHFFRKREKSKKKKSWGRPITRTGEKQLNWRCREAANHAAVDRERRGRAAGQTTSLSSPAIAFSWSWNYAVKSHTHRHTQIHNLQEKVIFCRFLENLCLLAELLLYLQFCQVFPRADRTQRIHRRSKTQALSNPIIGVVRFQ